MKKNTLLATIGCICLLAFQLAAQTETRVLGNFNKINISGGYDQLILQPGSENSITLSGSTADLKKIETVVGNETLGISTQEGRYRNMSKVVLTVTFKSLNEVNISGSTDVSINGTLKADEFVFSCSGSSDFIGNLDVKKLKVAISGSGDMKLAGVADEQNYAISGSGDVKATELAGKNAKVAISGSGDVELNVSGDVKTAISGSGNVTNSK